jgi:hypothetical protein
VTANIVVLLLVWFGQADGKIIGGLEAKPFDTIQECEKGKADLLASAAATPIEGIIGMEIVCVPVSVKVTAPKGAE